MTPSNGREPKSIKAVLDTNVFISAFLFRGRLVVLAEKIKRGEVLPCLITTTLRELREALLYDRFYPALDSRGVNSDTLTKTIVAMSAVLPDPPEIPRILADTPDNYILAAALAHRTDYIVSGDKHLLALGSFHNIPILPPREFLKLL